MDDIPYLYAGLALSMGALATIAVWSRRRMLWKTAAVTLTAATLALGYLGYIDLLSQPKPLGLEIRHLKRVDVISAVLREGKAIYLWLNVEGEPRFYELPWNSVLALELQAAMREARQAGTGVGMRLQELEGNFEGSVENRKGQRFYPQPIPAPPEKQRIILQSPNWDM